MSEIAEQLECSLSRVKYWITRHSIETRSISDAAYIKHNPKGDPFVIKTPQNRFELILYGLGLGLYWGEGTKASN